MTLGNLTFKCKFASNGCKEVVKYVDLKTHSNNCKFKEKIFEKYSSKDINNSLFKLDNPRKSVSESFSKLNGVTKFKCNYCSELYEKNDDFLTHYNKCKKLSNYIEKCSNDPTQFLENKINEVNELRTNYQKLNTAKYQNLIIKLMNNYNKFIENKPLLQGTKDEEKKETSFFDARNFNDKIDKLNKEKVSLTNEKYELEKFINNFEIDNNYNSNQSEALLKHQISVFQKLLFNRKGSVNDKYALFKDDGKSKCIVCGDVNPDTKKYHCKTCRNYFCENKCIVKCNSENCKSEEFICPRDNVNCSLCHKLKYCDKCKKKCFYNNCSNMFCAECYKKNEHQARGATVNCNFFTCERDQKNDCLMTSLFCNKCEKRLCNNCIINDAHDNFK